MKKSFFVIALIATIVFVSFATSTAFAASAFNASTNCNGAQASAGFTGLESNLRTTSQMPWDFPVVWKDVSPQVGRANVIGANQLHVDVENVQLYVLCGAGGMTYNLAISGDQARLTSLYNASGHPLGLRVNDEDLGIFQPGPASVGKTFSVYPKMLLVQTLDPASGKPDNIVVLAASASNPEETKALAQKAMVNR